MDNNRSQEEICPPTVEVTRRIIQTFKNRWRFLLYNNAANTRNVRSRDNPEGLGKSSFNSNLQRKRKGDKCQNYREIALLDTE